MFVVDGKILVLCNAVLINFIVDWFRKSLNDKMSCLPENLYLKKIKAYTHILCIKKQLKFQYEFVVKWGYRTRYFLRRKSR